MREKESKVAIRGNKLRKGRKNEKSYKQIHSHYIICNIFS